MVAMDMYRVWNKKGRKFSQEVKKAWKTFKRNRTCDDGDVNCPAWMSWHFDAMSVGAEESREMFIQKFSIRENPLPQSESEKNYLQLF